MSGDRPPERVTRLVGDLVAEDSAETLADLYATVVRPENRRRLGTFFTPVAEARSMVETYAGRYGPPSEIVDIGAGVGIFSEATAAKWPSARVHAVDINPVTLGLQLLVHTTQTRARIQLELADYASWLKTFAPKGSTLYVGNPPYTRWQLIPPGDRPSLLSASGGLVAGRPNLSSLFLAITLRAMRPQDTLCLIVPSSWMSARFGDHLRSHVRGARNRRVELRTADSWQFAGATVDATVIEIGPTEGGQQELVITDWGRLASRSIQRQEGVTAPFPRNPTASTFLGATTSLKLRDLARVSRGIATGSNSTFIDPNPDPDEAGWFTPLLRRLRPGSNPAGPTAEYSYLLNLAGYEPGTNPLIDGRLAAAEEAAVNEGHLCKLRRRWFDLSGEVWTPDVVIAALSRDQFHVHINPSGATILNNLFGLRWHATTKHADRVAVVDWLRSEPGQTALRDSATLEADKLFRLSPRAVGNVAVPLPLASVVTVESKGVRGE